MSNVIDLSTHPTFFRRRLLRQSRALAAECRTTSHTLSGMRVALLDFSRRLDRHRERLAPTRADNMATLAAIEGGDVAEMERLRDRILHRRRSQQF